MIKKIAKALWLFVVVAAWAVVLLTLFPHVMAVFDRGGAGPFLLIGSVCIIFYHVRLWLARKKAAAGLAKLRESAALLCRQNELKHADCVNEYIYWLRKEHKAKEYIKNEYPGEFLNLEPWIGDFNVDIEWINKELPDNYEFRQKLEELKKSEKRLWEQAAWLSRKEDEQKAQDKELHPEKFCSVSDCLWPARDGSLCVFHRKGGERDISISRLRTKRPSCE